MKLNPFLPLSLLALAGHLAAAPLTESAAVQTQPDPAAPVITVLSPGTEPTVAPTAEGTPGGWTAVQLAGPFDGYVRNADLTKQLEIRPGTSIHLAPKPDAGVLTVFAQGDKATITGLHGAWTQVHLDKSVIGYIHVGSTTPAAPTAMAAAAAPVSAPAPSAPMSAPSPSAAGTGTAQAGRAYDSGDTSALPRTFEGTFVSTRRPLAPRRPYDWQVNDSSGQRYAFLDITKLLLTDQIENYAGREVTVFGTARPVPGTKDLVITVESLRLK